MANPCLECPLPCCHLFWVSTEVTNPPLFRLTLSQHPEFTLTPETKLVLAGKREAVVHLINCSRFDFDTGTCIGYDTIPRADFCHNTGVVSSPHDKCILRLQVSGTKPSIA